MNRKDFWRAPVHADHNGNRSQHRVAKKGRRPHKTNCQCRTCNPTEPPMTDTTPPGDEHRPECAAGAGEECECAYLDALDIALDDPDRRGPRGWDEPDGIDA